MKKVTLIIGALILIGGKASGQIGVNTAVPKTTMDVSAKRNAGGTITDNAQLLGLQAPRLTLAELVSNTATYGADQRGAMIYITDISGGGATGQRININAIGYYFFNGTLWQKLVSDNIYNANGSLTNDRTLTIDGKTLHFNGTDQETFWSADGSMNQSGSNGTASLSIYGGNDSNLYIQQFRNAEASISATGNSTAFNLGTHGTNNSAPITFHTSIGGGALGTEKMRITGEGNVAVNNTTPTEKFDVNGNTRLRSLPLNGATNSIYTQSNGSASSSQNQTFTATRTVVADANGVLGYVSGLPSTGSGTAPSGTINIGETISITYSIPNATAIVSTFNLKDYVVANGLPSLPVIDGLEMNLQGVNSTYYDPRVYNVSSTSKLISYQSFASQVNENKTSLNNTVAANGFVQVDANNIVFWTTTAAEVETTNLQVQIDANTYRWYEFKWWCMEVSGQKKIFLSVTRKA